MPATQEASNGKMQQTDKIYDYRRELKSDDRYYGVCRRRIGRYCLLTDDVEMAERVCRLLNLYEHIKKTTPELAEKIDAGVAVEIPSDEVVEETDYDDVGHAGFLEQFFVASR